MFQLNTRRLKYIARSSGPLKRWLSILSSLILQVAWEAERHFSIGKFSVTVLSFLVFLLALPIFLVSFICLTLYRKALKCWILWREKDVEIADVTFRTVLESRDQAAIVTFLFKLEGLLQEEDIKNWVERLLYRNFENGKLVHSNFKRRLIHLHGFPAWKYYSEFCIDDHIVVNPSHHQGRTLTDRNIQECVSELCSSSLSENQSPWQVNVLFGLAEGGDPVTWVIFRLHHLLSTELKFPDFPATFPNPWDSYSSARGFPLLEAPTATRKLAFTLNEIMQSGVQKLLDICFVVFKTFLSIYRSVMYCNCYKQIISHFSTFGIKLTLSKWFQIFIKEIKKHQKFRVEIGTCVISMILFISKKIVRFSYFFKKLPSDVKNRFLLFKSSLRDGSFGNKVHASLFKDAAIEIYWIIRATFSGPRLLMEEIYAMRHTAPLNIWRKNESKTWKRTIVSWSDEIPLGGAEGVKGVTGASLSSVLITALSGATRDLLRYSGTRTPDCLRCTLPICFPQTSPNQGLLPLSLPTGSSYGQIALKEVSKCLEQMRKYPERYLASAWLLKNITKFLPNSFLRRIINFLTTYHPLLLINLVGPATPTTLWGLQLVSVFYWRPPQHNAVISVCISSYCGKVSLGVLADGWAVPHASIFPKSFISHLNELAIESGVRLERMNSRTRNQKRITRSTSSQKRSANSTPSPTPPPTPMLSNEQTQFSYSTLLTSIKRTRRPRSFSTFDKMKKDSTVLFKEKDSSLSGDCVQ